MNKNINLCEILKGHEDETFYSPVYGIVRAYIEGDKIKMIGRYNYMMLNSKGFNDNHEDLYDCLECLIFPSKDRRDWNKWIEEQKSKVSKTWSELVKNRKAESHCIHTLNNTYLSSNKNKVVIEKSALALLKIHQLIEVEYGGNVTNDEWVNSDGNNLIYVPFYNPLKKEFQSFGVFGLSRKSLIAFHTYKQIKEFLKYPENVQLLKDYFMIWQ